MFESDSPSPGCSEANTPTLRTQLSLEVLIIFLYVSDLCRDQSFIRPSPVQRMFRIDRIVPTRSFLATSCNGTGIESLLKVRT